MFTRETLIALRARRQAHQVAGDIAFPHIETKPPPALPLEPYDPEEVQEHVKAMTRYNKALRGQNDATGQLMLSLLVVFGVVFLSIVLLALCLDYVNSAK